MDLIYLILIWVILSVATAVVATQLGRSFFGYLGLSILLSPAFAFFTLIAVGKSNKQIALDEIEIERIKGRLYSRKSQSHDNEIESNTDAQMTQGAAESSTTELSSGVMIALFLIILILLIGGCYLLFN